VLEDCRVSPCRPGESAERVKGEGGRKEGAQPDLLSAPPRPVLLLKIHLLGLSPITPKRTSLTDRYKYLICSSSLLDSTLPRATDQETASTLTDPSDPSSTSSPTNLLDLDTDPPTPPNPHKLVVLGCIPLFSLILPLSPLWRSLLFVLLGLLALSLSLLVKVAPSINMEGDVDGLDRSASSQREAVESMKELVCEAEALDRCVNAVLRRLSSTEKSS
jgi:hypothetical protein